MALSACTCWKASIVAVAALLLLVLAAPALAQSRSVVLRSVARPQLAPANPAFVVWQAMRGLEPVLDAASPHGLGERPGPQPVLTARTDSGAGALLGYAKSFDLRTQSPAKLTAVRDQGAWGACWTFGTYGAMESDLLPGETDDFSEDNLVLNSGFDTGSTPAEKYDHGGNLTMATAYLTRWSGPVYESDDAYGDGTTPAGLSPRKHVQDVSWYAPRASDTDNDRIKYALTTYGAVMATMSWQGAQNATSPYYNASTNAYYYNGSSGTNHAVDIVGWDDNYAASNFSTTPPGNGAFIVRNSWGSGWGASGYFYLSYYDTQFARASDCATFEGVQSASNYGAIYQYDPLGYTAATGYGSTTAWMANMFTATSAQQLDAVGFYALAASTAYEVYAGPSLAGLTKVASGTLEQAGFHTVTVPAGTTWAAAGTFVVAVKLTTPGLSTPVALEYPSAGYASPTAATGQSYMSNDGTSWTDVAASYADTNVCLKAYASRIPISSCSYSFAAGAATDWKTTAQTVTITAGGGDGTGRTIHYSQDGGTIWSTSTAASVNVSVSAEGVHDFRYYASDSLATEGTHKPGYVNIDTVKPSTSDNHLSVALSDPCTVTLTPSDATSGVALTEYKVDGAASYTAGTSVVLHTGTHTVTYRSTDKAGNVESPDKTFTVTVNGPSTTTSYSGFAADAVSGWKTGAQTVKVTAVAGSGTGLTIHTSQDGGVSWSTAAGTSATISVTADGAHEIEYYATDSLATEYTHNAGWINIDSVPPVTTDDHSTASLVAPATITLTPSDTTSGMSGGAAMTEYKVDGAASYTTGTSVVLSDGTHTVAYRSTDKAGNRESPDKSFTVTVLAPSIPVSTSDYTFAPNALSGWKNTAQQFTITAAGGSGTGRTIHYSLDGGATWSTSAAASVDVPVPDGAHHVRFYADDSLACEGEHDAGWVNVDTAAPATTASKAGVKKGAKVTLAYRVTDGTPGCGKAVLTLQILKDARVVTAVKLGTKATNVALKYTYRAKLKKGGYTWRVLATDIAGNAATKTKAARLVIR